MTDREKAVVMARTGICMLKGEKLDVFYRYLAELFGRPVYTHEWLALESDIKEKSKPDFLELCREEEPERKMGRWYKPQGYPRDSYRFICDNCHNVAYFVTGNNGKKNKSDNPKCGYHSCPNCGAKMEGTDG